MEFVEEDQELSLPLRGQLQEPAKELRSSKYQDGQRGLDFLESQ
jgi:hypothetical protein